MSEVIDVFCHWLPAPFAAAALKAAGGRLFMLKRAAGIAAMVEPEARSWVMDEFPGYVQIPSIALPPIELIAGAGTSADLARIANDGQAELVAEYPGRFAGFVAALPMDEPEAAVAEATRAMGELGASGVQMFTSVNGGPLDEAGLEPLFERLAELDRPIWLHPVRGMDRPDYPTEQVSRYELWWALGWPYETSLAMGRLVFAGVFDRWPDLKIIAHHAGGMVPMVAGRLSPGLDELGSRCPPARRDAVATALRERPVDAFRRFYADTATFGSAAAIECALAFFGPDRLLFGSDMPFGPQGGPGYIRSTLVAIEELGLSAEDQRAILAGNARRLLGLEAGGLRRTGQ